MPYCFVNLNHSTNHHIFNKTVFWCLGISEFTCRTFFHLTQKRMKKFLALVRIFLFVFPIYLFAQTNESDTLKLQASLSSSGVFQGGNVQTVIFRVNSDVSYKPWKKWVFKNKNSFVYQEFGKTKADEDILSPNFLYFNPEQKVYPLLLGFVSTNFRRKINIRSLVGGGITFQVLNKIAC